MATNKKAISAYLPSELEEYLTKYCIEYDITRKDKSGEIKPALGTAVVEILKRFFSDENVPSPLPDNVPLLPSNVVTEDRLKEVLSEFESSSKAQSSLPSNVLTKDDLEKQVEAAISEAIPKAIAELKSDGEFLGAIALEVQKIDSISSENALGDEEAEEGKETARQVDKSSLNPISEEVAAAKSSASTSLTDNELAERLGMSKSTIYRYRTGKPKQSPDYRRVMQNWKPVGDRWYQKGE